MYILHIVYARYRKNYINSSGKYSEQYTEQPNEVQSTCIVWISIANTHHADITVT